MYIKPLFEITNDTTEGVYMASGCYTVTSVNTQKPQTGRGDYRIQVNATHKSNHTCEHQRLYVSFNQNIIYKSSNGTLVSGSGTPHIAIDFYYHNNPTDNIGLGDLVVEAENNLEVVHISLDDMDN